MFTTRPEIQGTFGVVTSTHWLASASGMAMLECGDNAFDAAIAAGFVKSTKARDTFYRGFAAEEIV